MSKYDALWTAISNSGTEHILLRFSEIEDLLGFPIDHSFLNYKKELTSSGYSVKKVSIKQKTVIFEKTQLG